MSSTTGSLSELFYTVCIANLTYLFPKRHICNREYVIKILKRSKQYIKQPKMFEI